MPGSICMIGDSISKGVVFDSMMNKYTLLKDNFVNMFKGRTNVSVKNYSLFGCTVTKGLEIFGRHKDEVKNYDYTVLEFGGNDCDFNWAEVSAQPDKAHLPKTPVDDFERKYQSLIAKIKECGGHPVVLSLPPIDAKRYFAWISKNLNPKNILRWLGDIGYIYRWHEMYNLATCRLANECGVPFIDISSAFLEKPDYSSLICEDGIHPNKAGHELICKTIYRTINRYQETCA
ncbi:MAG TPA: hypothetical protein DIV41_08060 [Ruminococcaceae bacterium]|nr:hypothetical protein [Oscillospiraceae bacterium]